MQSLEMTPLWDEAISALLSETQANLDAPLDIALLQQLAVNQAIRLGDILETLYLMAIYGDWTYQAQDGGDMELNEQALEDLYAHGRIDTSNAQAFAGLWAPKA